MPAAVRTVTNTLEAPGTGKACPGRLISIRLNTPGFIDGGIREKVRAAYATTDADGMWSAVLEVNADIDPAGTSYTVAELPGLIWTFIVPAGDPAVPVTLRDCLVNSPTNPAPMTSGATLGELAAEAAARVQGDADTLAAAEAYAAALPADAAGWLHDDGSGGLAWSTPTKSAVGLGNVDNTADSGKPVSTAQATADAAVQTAAASDATTKANAAQAAAIAASDPLGAAAAAQAAAIAAAAADATTKANAAQAAAIAAASADATTKANAAQAAAIAASDPAGAAASAQAAAIAAAHTDAASQVAAEQARADAAYAVVTEPVALTKLAKASNLSDLASASAARTNLGLGTAATQPSSAFDAAGVAAAAVAAEQTRADSVYQPGGSAGNINKATAQGVALVQALIYGS